MGEPGFSLYLPTKVAEEIAAERRREYYRGPPVQILPRGTSIQGLGRQPTKQQLLEENAELVEQYQAKAPEEEEHPELEGMR